jgi:hypothetical protein
MTKWVGPKQAQRTRRRKLAAVTAAAAAAAVTVAAQPGAGPALAAVRPGVVASSRVQDLINTVRGQASTYAGLWLDSKAHTVYVSTAKSGVTASTVAALEPRPAARAATMRIVVVHARYDFAQLEKIDGRVIKDAGLHRAAKASHATLSEWYPDPETDKVVIGFTKVTAAEKAEVRAEYGTTARVITAPIAKTAIGRLRPGSRLPRVSRLRLESKARPDSIHPFSRYDDYAPWYGGDEITYDGGWYCTSGYEFSSNVMSTAGQCGSDPEDFYNNGAFYGETYTMQWGGGRIDMQLMDGSDYYPAVWAGSGGYTPEGVSGSGGVAQGGQYCTSGSITGQSCSAIVDAIDVCQVEYDPFTGGDVNVCDLDEAYSSDGISLAQAGDAGGPVYTAQSTGDPYAVGTISADNDTTTVWWSDMYMEKQIFHTAPETQYPTDCPPLIGVRSAVPARRGSRTHWTREY